MGTKPSTIDIFYFHRIRGESKRVQTTWAFISSQNFSPLPSLGLSCFHFRAISNKEMEATQFPFTERDLVAEPTKWSEQPFLESIYQYTCICVLPPDSPVLPGITGYLGSGRCFLSVSFISPLCYQMLKMFVHPTTITTILLFIISLEVGNSGWWDLVSKKLYFSSTPYSVGRTRENLKVVPFNVILQLRRMRPRRRKWLPQGFTTGFGKGGHYFVFSSLGKMWQWLLHPSTDPLKVLRELSISDNIRLLNLEK